MCIFIISGTFENPCTFENVTELKNLETQGLRKVFTPPQTPPEGAKSIKSIEFACFYKGWAPWGAKWTIFIKMKGI